MSAWDCEEYREAAFELGYITISPEQETAAVQALWSLPMTTKAKMLAMCFLFCNRTATRAIGEMLSLLERLAAMQDTTTRSEIANMLRASAARIYSRLKVVN